MKTKFTIYRVGEEPEQREVDIPRDPGYVALAGIIEPLLDGNYLERVAVLVDGKPTDMFVDEMGHLKNLPTNEAATGIYRALTMRLRPETNPETLHAIAGTAIVFHRRVWF